MIWMGPPPTPDPADDLGPVSLDHHCTVEKQNHNIREQFQLKKLIQNLHNRACQSLSVCYYLALGGRADNVLPIV